MNIIKPERDLIEVPQFGGIFTFEKYRDGKLIDQWEEHNLVPTAGLNHFLDTELGGSTQVSSWYIGLYSNAYTPQADDTYSHIGTRFTEITSDYSEGNRPAWTKNAVAASGSISNSSNKATFTFTGTVTVSGAMFVSSNVKGDNTSGVLLAASAASPSKSMTNGEELLVTYTFTGTSS